MATKKRSRFPLWSRIAMAAVAAVIVLMLTAVGLRYWITSDMGRGFVVSMIDGKRIPGLGVIRIVGGLKGDPLTAASLADIALVDDKGPWLRASDVRLEWDGTKLLSGQLDIKAIDIAKVHVLRMPQTERQRERGGARPNTELSLGRLTITELRLEPNVLGPAATFTVTGAAARAKDLSGHAELLFAPISGPGDRIDASARWTSAGDLTGKIDAGGPSGGALATLLQAPAGDDIAVTGAVSGALTRFTADAHLTLSGADTATIHVARNGAAADLTAQLHAGKWPLFDVATKRTGDDFDLIAHAQLADSGPIPVTARLAAPAGRIDASFTYTNAPVPLDAMHIEADNLDLDRITAKQISGRLAGKGDVSFGPGGLPDWTWKGDVAVDAFGFPNGRAQRATMKLSVSRRGDAFTWAASQGEALGVRLDPLKDLKPARYEFSTTGDINLKSNLASISRAQIRGDTISAAANGRYGIETGALKLEGLADVARLSEVSPFAGMARGNWSVERASEKAPWRIAASVAGRNVGSSNTMLARLAGPNPTAKLSAFFRDGRFSIESGEFRGDGLEAHMVGHISDTGAITATASGRLRRPLDLGGSRLDALSFMADISGKSSAPLIDAHFSNGAALLAGLSLTGVGGNGRIMLGPKPSGNLAFAGAADGQALSLRTDFAGADGGWSLTNAELKLAGVKADVVRFVLDKDGAIDAAWSASGSLAGLYGVEAGALSAKGTAKSNGQGLDLQNTGQITDFRRGVVDLDLASFELAARNNEVTLDSHIKGEIGTPVDLTLKAHGAQAGAQAGLAGDASLSGRLDRARIATPQPVKWTYAAEGWSVDGAVNGLGGSVEGKASLTHAGAAADLKIDSIDVSALTRLARSSTALVGEVSGTASFRNAAGRTTADFALDGLNMNPAGISADPVNIHLKGKLADDQLRTDVSGAGQGFSLTASALVRVIAHEGFDVAPDAKAPLEASLSLDGRAEQLWGVFGPEGQSLRGHVAAKVSATGTIASPALQGDFTVNDGAFEHGETGLKLYHIASVGQFSQRSLRIVSLAADDGANGRFTGDGEITWDKGLDGAINFKADNLRALARDDRFAIVSGEGALSLDPDAVRVKGQMNVVQARISVEQPAAARIPTLPKVTRVNFPNQQQRQRRSAQPAEPQRPVVLDMKITAARRVVVFGRGLDTEWSTDFAVTGKLDDPIVRGAATLVRGDLSLAGKRFAFDTGTITFDGPIRTSRIDISATRTAVDITATVRVSGTPVEPKFTLESTPSLPQDEILARVLFGRTASQLSGLEAAQLAAGLAELAGGQAGFNPAGLLRQATGLDRVAVGASEGAATVQAGKYLSDNVYVQLGAGGAGGAGAEVEWEPQRGLSITSSAQANGDTRLGVRWKKDFGKPPPPQPPPAATPPAGQPSAPATGSAPQPR